MSLIVADIKEELAARIAACKKIAYGGIADEALKVRMRARSLTLQSVLSWITGQEQLRESSGWTTVTTLRKDKTT